jgi:hypothetical protein
MRPTARSLHFFAILILLLSCCPLVDAQSATDSPQSSVSPLNGNWYIAGNRVKQQFPILSVYLHVDGTHVTGHGYVQARCPNAPESGGGGSLALNGEIGADGIFTLKNGPRTTLQVALSGKIPAQGTNTWSGEYTLAGNISHNCPGYSQRASFTATSLPPLSGAFSGVLKNANETEPRDATFRITVTQGPPASQTLKRGDAYFYLPLTGTVQVSGLSCFSHGQAYALTYSTHGSVPSRYSTLGGDFLNLWFEMDDESQVNMLALFADPGASALKIIEARIVGGDCANQIFLGTLERK